MDVVLTRSQVLNAAPASPLHASLRRIDQPDDGPALVARRLGPIITLLAVIALILLFLEGETDQTQRIPYHIAKNIQSSTSENRAKQCSRIEWFRVM
jgi:hypothetical protein